eukprot:TRINITY_DN9284_c0_g2_i1.p1 TRINITY_DN9284_c0_g2~~TRINITY_DN9284_c0_g2_i1.p1  ORF type:complete len:1278 (+),score=249.80 TRINITY_DN9284_c0_g2_i1:84-3836(+)
MALCECAVSWVYRDNEPAAERALKQTVFLPGLVTSIYTLATFVFYSFLDGRGEVIHAWNTGLLIATAALWAPTAHVALTKHAERRHFQVAMLVVVLGIVCLDWAAVALPGTPRAWMWSVLVVDALLVLNSSSRWTHTVVVVILVWLAISSSEDVWRWGLYRVDHWSTPEPESKRDLMDCADPPCPISAAAGAARLLGYALVFVCDFYMTRRFATEMRAQMEAMEVAVTVTEDIAVLLAGYDTEAAQVLVTDRGAALPDRLRGAISQLLGNLCLYRPYLPDAVVGREGEEDEVPDEEGEEDAAALEMPIEVTGTMSSPLLVDGQLFKRGPASLDALEQSRRTEADFGLDCSIDATFTAGAKRNSQATSDSVRGSFGPGHRRSLGGACAELVGALPRFGSSSTDSQSELSCPSRMASPLSAVTPSSLRGGNTSPSSRTPRVRFPGHEAEAQRQRVAKSLDVGASTCRGSVMMAALSVRAEMLRRAQGHRDSFNTAREIIEHHVHAVREGRGTVMHFTATYCLSTWNAHRTCPRYALAAVRCAVASAQVCRTWDHAISAGTMLRGHIGTSQLRAAFVEGQPARQVHALVWLCPRIGCRLLTTEQVRELTHGNTTFQKTDWAEVMVDVVPAAPLERCGQAMRVYALFYPTQADIEGYDPLFAEALNMMRAGDAAGAEGLLTEVLEAHASAIRKQTAGAAGTEDVVTSLTQPHSAPSPCAPEEGPAAGAGARDAAARGSFTVLQAKRLRTIAHAAAKDPSQLPLPYCRQWIGWGSCGDSFASRPGTPRSSQGSFGMSPHGFTPQAFPLDGNQAARLPQKDAEGRELTPQRQARRSTLEKLEEAIRNAGDAPQLQLMAPSGDEAGVQSVNTEGVANPGDSIASSTSVTTAPGKLPTEFLDQRGHPWRRSDKLLGRGAFGEVWMGMSSADGELVAIKAVKLPQRGEAQDPGKALTAHERRRRAAAARLAAARGEKTPRSEGSPSSSPGSSPPAAAGALADLITEVDVLGRLQHDQIVCYLGATVAAGHLVLVMEFVSGGSLEGLIKQFGALPEHAVRRYTGAILRGLSYLHSNGIVHRDFKPGNVLLHSDGHVKIADFGASGELRKLTRQEIVGTPLYMAPEAARGHAEAASDVWGVGVTVCEMLTGQVPYDVNSDSFRAAAFVYQLSSGAVHPVLPPRLREQEPSPAGSAHSRFNSTVGSGGALELSVASLSTRRKSQFRETPLERQRSFVEACLHEDVSKRASIADLLRHSFLVV